MFQVHIHTHKQAQNYILYLVTVDNQRIQHLFLIFILEQTNKQTTTMMMTMMKHIEMIDLFIRINECEGT